MKKTNKEIAHLLRCVGGVYELKGFNRFRRIAYEQAADAVDHLNREIYDIWKNDELENVSGIGSTLSAHIDEYFSKRGSKKTYIMSQVKDFPQAMFELMKVPGLGAKRAFILCQKFDINSSKSAIKKLLKIALSGKIAELDGFGDKSQNAIITAVRTYLQEQNSEVRISLPEAFILTQEIISHMKLNPHVQTIEALGSLRRRVATIGDIDLAVVAKPSFFTEIISHFITYPGRVKIESQGQKKASMTVVGGHDVDLRVSDEENYGSMLQYFTGSKRHNIKLREYALKKGYSLSEFGIKEIKSGKHHNFKTEESLYNFLGLSYIPPEIREGTEEIKLAHNNRIPDLAKISDIRGDLQIHSNYDLTSSHDIGEDSVEEIIKKAKTLGYKYVALTDHNPAQCGNSIDKIVRILKKRFEYMSLLKNKFNLIISIEADITPDGGIAIPVQALKYVDMILISIHSSFRQPRTIMTRRIIKALSNPKVKVLAHPTGRLLGKRQEIEADWNEIFRECKRKNIAVEINACPYRLDLPDSLVRQAKQMGLKFTLGTDAHAASNMDNMRFGVAVARRGWLTKNDIINTGSWLDVRNWMMKV